MRTKNRPTFRRPKPPRAAEPAPFVSHQERLVIRTTAYVDALHQAWFATALEQTKSIFTLASAGIGLALTLLFTAYRDAATWVPGWLLAAAIFFGFATTACICVFSANANLVKSLIITNQDDEAANGFVKRMHFAGLICFLCGIVFLLAAGFAFILFGGPSP